MGRDGGWPGIQLSTGWARVQTGIIYIVTPVRSESLSLSLSFCDTPGASHFLHFFFHIPFIGFHLHLFLRTSSPHLCFTLTPHLLLALFAFHVRLRRSSRFMRSLSIFHDSMFYCLYESFYPAFLLARDISLRSVTFYA